jgi:hypothetical protein
MKLMHQSKLALALAAALMGANVSNAAPITYYVNQTIGIGSVTGSIMTDGAFGTLANADITGWNLHLNNGAATFDLNLGNSKLGGSGQVTATSQQLTYDFSSGAYFGFFINGTVGSLVRTGWCLQSGNGQCSFAGVSGESVGVQNATYTDPFRSLTGTQVIASVPEPETYGMMIVGLGMMGFIGLRRRNPRI